MIRNAVRLTCCALLLDVVSFYSFPTLAPLAAEAAAVHNPEVARYLSEAQKVSANKQWNTALAMVMKAKAVPDKSAYAEYKIDEFRAYLLTQLQKYAEAAAVFEHIAASSQASAAARNGHLKTAAQLYHQTRDYQRAAAVAQRALAQRPDDAQVLETLAQAEYLAGSFRETAATLRRLLAVAQKQGTKPKESWLQMLLNSYDRLQDKTSMDAAWETLLRNYPKPEYWRAVLAARSSRSQPAAIELGYLRLMFDLNLLTDPADFEDLAMNAIDTGVPGEAVRALQAALRQKPLSAGAAARFRRMLSYAQDEAAKQRSQVEDLTRHAKLASSGELSTALGRLQLGEGRYEAAAAALSQGLKQGNLRSPDQVRVDLGISLLKSQQLEQARQIFASVGRKSEWRDLAELWGLRAQHQPS